MLENNVTKFCMAACIFMLLISLSMNFVVGLGIPAFSTAPPSPIMDNDTKTIANKTASGVFSLIGESISSVLTGLLGVASISGLALAVLFAWRTGSWAIVAAYLFGMVFWGSWIANLSLFNYGNYFETYPVFNGLYLMITVVMVFVFAGATIGILGGHD